MKYATKTLYAQWLPGPEVKTDTDSVLLELVHWKPAAWALGQRHEMLVGRDESVSDVCARLDKLTGIPAGRLRLGRSTSWAGTPRAQLESLRWEQVAAEENDSATVRVDMLGGSAISALSLCDSDLFYFKDSDEVVRELTAQEKAAADLEAADFRKHQVAATPTSSTSSKEKGLSIRKRSPP